VKQPKVTVGLIPYLGQKYLLKSIPSLLNQDYPNIEFHFRDQSPNAEAYQFIKTHLPEVFEKVKFEHGENLMHSGGHNTLIRAMQGEYYLCASYDMLYPSNLISTLVECMERPENKKYGSATCKLMHWDFDGKKSPGGQSNILDSLGISLTHSHQFFEIGQGEVDHGQYNDLKDIFGPSGALSFFRREALEDVAYINKSGQKEYYDQLLHYKNDVDLAYRLQWAGWPSLAVPTVKVYHDRQVANKESHFSRLINIIKNRKNISNWAKESSFIGHEVVMKKNYRGQPFSFFTRLKTDWLYFLRQLFIHVFERHLLKQQKIIKSHSPEILDKARQMPRKVPPATIEKLMH